MGLFKLYAEKGLSIRTFDEKSNYLESSEFFQVLLMFRIVVQNLKIDFSMTTTPKLVCYMFA